MRILYIIQHFAGYHGSGGVRAYEFAKRLVRSGHQVTLLCGSNDRSSPEDIESARRERIEVIQAGCEYSQKLSFAAKIANFARFMRWATRVGKALPVPDVVLASSTPLTVGEVGRAVAVHHGVPFVFEVRDLWPEVPIALGVLRNPLLRFAASRLAARIYRAADHVVALSPGMRDGVMTWGVPETKISVIPNCSNPALFADRSGRSAFRDTYHAGAAMFCVHPGAMGIVNGLDYLLDCGRILDQSGAAGIRIALIGSGTQSEHLQRRIAREGISCVSIHGPIEKLSMPGLLAAADVGIMCVRPNPVLEANSANKFFDFLAAGLPVVLNYGGWQAEMIRREGAGVAVSPADPREMAQALVALHNSPATREKMGANAKRLGAGPYNIDHLAGEFEAVLRGVVSRRHSAPAEGLPEANFKRSSRTAGSAHG